MKEFMLIIRNTGDKMESMSPEKQKVFLEKVKAYIGKLEVKGILKGAQPLERQGKIISGTKGAFKTDHSVKPRCYRRLLTYTCQRP